MQYLDKTGLTYLWEKIKTALNTKSDTNHTHKYAGASSSGVSATSAVKLDTSTAGSATQPCYFTGGKPSACTYSLNKSVPSNAVFTDTNTTYSAGTGLSLSGTTFSADGSAIANALTTGNSTAQRADYIIAQYAGGGTTTTTYHRRPLSKIFGALNASDITNALGYTPPTTNTTYSAATTSEAGLMSAADKTKLDGIATSANAYTHPSYTAKTSGLYKVTVDATGHVSAATAVTKADITGLGIPASDTNTTYSVATASANGLMPSHEFLSSAEIDTLNTSLQGIDLEDADLIDCGVTVAEYNTLAGLLGIS